MVQTIRKINTGLPYLIERGHYRLNARGELRSAHFSRLSPRRNNPKVFYTPLIAGQIADIRAGVHNCHYFGGTKNVKKISPYKGLENCVRLDAPQGPAVYVMDNHLMAFFAFYEALAAGNISREALLVHIDQHTDNFYTSTLPNSSSLSEIAAYTRRTMNNANFILPAVARSLFSQFWVFYSAPSNGPSFMTRHGNLEATTEEAQRVYYQQGANFVVPPYNAGMEQTAYLSELIEQRTDPRKLVIDIDLDAFVRKTYGNGLPSEKDFAKILPYLAEICGKAGAVTIATSPGHADQSVAIPLARRLAEEINGGTRLR